MQSPTADMHDPWREHYDRMGSSSPEPIEAKIHHSTTTRDGVRIPGIRRPSGPSLDYSGDETGAYASDFSDMTNPGPSDGQPTPYGSLTSRKNRQSATQIPQAQSILSSSNPRSTSIAMRNASYASLPADGAPESSERTIHSGYLLALKTGRAGVRQWKKMWVVLRSKHVAFYKTDEEYAAILILPLSSCIDAVEIDALSRSKKHCMQLITEEKGYRFCANTEDEVAQWLGAIKMQLSRRKEGRGL